jgi:hypothetical protein
MNRFQASAAGAFSSQDAGDDVPALEFILLRLSSSGKEEIPILPSKLNGICLNPILFHAAYYATRAWIHYIFTSWF